MRKSKFSHMLAVAAGLSIASGAFAMPAAPRTVTVGDDKTRYSWKEKPPADPKPVRTMKREIAEWNHAIDTKNANKARGKQVRKLQKRDARVARIHGYGLEQYS